MKTQEGMFGKRPTQILLVDIEGIHGEVRETPFQRLGDLGTLELLARCGKHAGRVLDQQQHVRREVAQQGNELVECGKEGIRAVEARPGSDLFDEPPGAARRVVDRVAQ